MAFALKEIVPWGRNYEEYVAMFGLTEGDVARSFVDCGGGPSSFNSTLTRLGGKCVSVDPIYQFPPVEIRQRIAETHLEILQQTEVNRDQFLWDRFATPEEMGQTRLEAMEEFLGDYSLSRDNGRYVAGALPELPFPDQNFDVALSSHFLFLYTAQLSLQFHRSALEEMIRVAHEVRVFPLLSLDNSRSSYLKNLIEHFSDRGYTVSIQRVPCEFQKGANEVLIIKE